MSDANSAFRQPVRVTMARPAPILLAAVAAFALASCSKEPKDKQPASIEPTASVDAETSPSATSLTTESSALPAAVQGRWGLVPADCTSTRGDAKGLLVVRPDRLRFYEAVAHLSAIVESDERHVRAVFTLEGEGQEWTQDIEFNLADGGNALIRRDYGPDAMPEPLKYTRC